MPKLTQRARNNNFQYPIPNNYIVETEISEHKIRCETKYISNSKVCYTISWKEGRVEWSVNSTKSSTAVVNTFLQVCYIYAFIVHFDQYIFIYNELMLFC